MSAPSEAARGWSEAIDDAVAGALAAGAHPRRVVAALAKVASTAGPATPLPPLQVVVAAPMQGKTTRLIEWVRAGERIAAYPGWSRVLVVANIHYAIDLRRQHGLHPHQIYALEEWQRAHGVGDAVAVALDDADYHLRRLIDGRGYLAASALAGEEMSA